MSKPSPDRRRRQPPPPENADGAATLRETLEKILREASRRFEGKSCERCLKIEALATAALKMTSPSHDETNEINIRELDKLLGRKRGQ
jgi:hypothetical protein